MIPILILSYLSLLSLFLNHPIPMGINLIFISLTTTLTIFLFSNSSWFSYIMFLIMVGGILILFLYMASLVPNETFSLEKVMYPSIIFIWPMLKKELLPPTFSFTNNLNNMFSLPSLKILILLAIFLLFTLMVISMITKIGKGPLFTKT